MNPRPRILALNRYYLPGYLAGGPIRSLANLVAKLGDEFHWNVLTKDHDFGQAEPYFGIPPDTWLTAGEARIFYVGKHSASPMALLRRIRETPHDLLYLNSFFDPRFSITPALAAWLGMASGKPLLLAPRGEFSSGAFRFKAWKKRPYVALSRLGGAYRNVRWHASTDLEAEDIRHVMRIPGSRIHVARDLAAALPAPLSPSSQPRGDEGLRVCFLSRIARKKNLDFALRALARVRSRVHFRIYGPKEDAEYWKECETLIAGLPGNVTVSYEGSIPAERVVEALARNDLFFFPTHGENFGHVFVEAWSAGLPVLTSDQTPWRNLQQEGVGWDLPLRDLDAFARLLEEVARWDEARLTASRARAMDFARRKLRDDEAVEDNRRMFFEVIRSGREAGV